MRYRGIAVLLVAGLTAACAPGAGRTRATGAQPAFGAAVSIIPQPRMLRVLACDGFRWLAPAQIEAPSAIERTSAAELIAYLRGHGIRSIVSADKGSVRFHILAHAQPRLGTEGYELTVDLHGVTIEANARAGLFYGVQTLEQITQFQERAPATRCVKIIDWPAHPWRGIHLDVSRHFFSVPVIERYLDVAARYKLNVFHWHLTDDQAWRFPVAKYPLLTAGVQSYSTRDIREVVKYAAARSITVVPEIELLGHSAAAERVYPQTQAFFDTVLRALMDVFPGPYVHIGGDEVVYSAGRSLLLRRIVRFVQAHHRLVVAWDDALAAGLQPSVIVMAWHGGAAASRAVDGRYGVVATPDGPLYFDAYQAQPSQEPRASAHMSTLEEVYDYTPSRRFLGVQANVWTEHISTANHLWYMTLPRELALAEIAWDSPENKNWESFLRRLPQHLVRLGEGGYTYRIPNTFFVLRAPRIKFVPVPGNSTAAQALTDSPVVFVTLRSVLPGARIRYGMQIDGLTKTPSAYVTPLRIRLQAGVPVELHAITLASAGRSSSLSTCIITRVSPSVFAAIHQYSRSWLSLVSP